MCSNPNCLQVNPQPIGNFNKDSFKYDGHNPRCRECTRKRNRDDAKSFKSKQRRSEYLKLPAQKRKLNASLRKKRKEDPMFRISENLRRAVNGCTKYRGFQKNSSLFVYLGCNSQEFKIYLESLFQPGMTWDNYGYGSDKWNIDHKIPLVTAKTVADLYRLNHFSNLQPMWQPENLKKGDKY